MRGAHERRPAREQGFPRRRRFRGGGVPNKGRVGHGTTRTEVVLASGVSRVLRLLLATVLVNPKTSPDEP